MPDGTTTPTLGADPYFVNPGNWDAATVAARGEILGHLKNKGWDAKSPGEAAAEMYRSYHELERTIGIPKDQILRKPKDAADKDGWTSFNKSMGVPEKSDGYDLKGVKFADGTELDDNFIAPFREAFHANGVRPDQAASIMSAVVKHIEGIEQSEVAERTAALAAGREAIEKSWGANKDANRFICAQAALKLGLGEDVIDNIEKQVGYEKTMNALLKIGQAMGEDKFIADPNRKSGDTTIMTREQATARLEQLKNDDDFVRKVNAGDSKANDEFNNLIKISTMGQQ